MVDGWLRRLTEMVLPQSCRYCAGPAESLALCATCAGMLPWNRSCCPRCALPQTHDGECPRCLASPPPFDAAFAAFRLGTPVQQSVHALKYRAGFLEARVLGVLLASRLAARGAPLPQLLLPVPLHPLRLLRRGYNQAHELARVIGEQTGIRVDPRAARRLRRTADQIGMSAAERRRNLRRAFAIERDLTGLHVALIDDVMTTGATLSELARACRAAGAARIEAWAVARVA